MSNKKPTILAITGSIRKDSYNLKALKVAIEGAEEAGAQVTLLDFNDFSLPLYDQDFQKEQEQGLPEKVVALKNLFLKHDAFLIASPEHNGTISATLKNIIDWVSRKASDDEVYLSCYANKVAALLGASPGGLGGLNSLKHLRDILMHMNVLVLPQQVSIPDAYNAIDESGTFNNEKKRESVKKLGRDLAEFLIKLQS